MIQVITVPDEEFAAYRTTVDFIQRYIFPGGMLLCPEQMAQLSKGAGLTLDEQFLFGTDYARTLELWQAEFPPYNPLDLMNVLNGCGNTISITLLQDSGQVLQMLGSFCCVNLR